LELSKKKAGMVYKTHDPSFFLRKKYCFFNKITGVTGRKLKKICMEFWWFLSAKHFLIEDSDVQSQIKK